MVFKTFSILVTLASCAGGADVTRNQDIEEVVDLKIPDQFLPSNQRVDEKPAKEDDTGAVHENISDLVNVKIPIIENNDIQPVSVSKTNENVDVKPSEPSISDAPEAILPSDNIKPGAPGPNIGDSGGGDVQGVVGNKVPKIVPGKEDENEIFVDISAIVDVKVPAIDESQSNISTETDRVIKESTTTTTTATAATTTTTISTETTGRFKCINEMTISIEKVCPKK